MIRKLIRFLFLALIICILTSNISAQKPKLKNVSWRDNWKIEIKSGIGTLLSPVPEKYLDRINNVNIPLHVPGPMGVFAFKKGISSHFEMGYQFDIMRIQGKVNFENDNITVLTQAYTHTYQIQYNFKGTSDFKPLYNYFIYYKIGGISLKNHPIDNSKSSQATNNKFISNVAVLTGIGGGINYQLSNNISLTGSIDLNRSSDSAGDIFQIQKLFYRSPNSVNSYLALSGGISYWFNFSKPKSSTYFHQKTETEKLLLKSRIDKRKGISSKENLPEWYNNRKGK